MKCDLDEKTAASLDTILGYMWSDEEAHWLDLEQPKVHIYHDLERVAKWLEKQQKVKK